MTGGSGFIGSHVVDGLLAGAPSACVVFDKAIRLGNLPRARSASTIVEGDVTDTRRFVVPSRESTGVFHMAVLPLGPTVESPGSGFEVNVEGTFNVFEAAQKAGVDKVVFSSASSVYGDTDDTMDESHPLGARTMYGASRRSPASTSFAPSTTSSGSRT